MKTDDKEADSLLSQNDFNAIMRTCHDYDDGWFQGDATRMQRCLHPDLIKRTIVRDPGTGQWVLHEPTSYQALVDYTAEGGGTHVPEAERVYQITILDAFRHIAVAKCVSPDYVDYVQLVRLGDDCWQIVNIIWEVREGEYTPET